uniref:transposase n=1 Tax=Rhizobium nepotum TaxID=1035271 RepID=UPI000A445E30
MQIHGIRPVIPPKANRKNPPPCDFKAYKDRNRIERMFNRLKQFRRIATRYDKTRKSFEAFLALASVKLWLPCIRTGAFYVAPFPRPKKQGGHPELL